MGPPSKAGDICPCIRPKSSFGLDPAKAATEENWEPYIHKLAPFPVNNFVWPVNEVINISNGTWQSNHSPFLIWKVGVPVQPGEEDRYPQTSLGCDGVEGGGVGMCWVQLAFRQAELRCTGIQQGRHSSLTRQGEWDPEKV